MQRVKDRATRIWYAEAILANGWSRNILAMQIETSAHLRQGNFEARLPSSDFVLTVGNSPE